MPTEKDPPPADTSSEDDLRIAEDTAHEELSPEQDLATELEAQKDRTLRLQAEMQNIQQRAAREINDERRYGSLPLMRDLLPVGDNMDRAIEAAEKDSDVESLLEGFKLVRQQLANVLTTHKCEPIEAEGQPFDPEQHEAILQQPSDEIPAGTVIMVTQTGCRLHQRVVRAPHVIVSSGPAES
ncbi:MAG: nucleotide exchange factor GrpE [Pirellulales bacterium]|nr:nucleotide exchange factor GrpE [Pirellulales bacterium]